MSSFIYRQNNGPKGVKFSVPRNCNVMLNDKGRLRLGIKVGNQLASGLGEYPRLSRWANETTSVLINKRGNRTVESEWCYGRNIVMLCWLWKWKEAMNQRMWHLLEAGQDKKIVFLLEISKEQSHADMLTLAQWDPFCIFYFQSSKIIILCCFKSLKFLVVFL